MTPVESRATVSLPIEQIEIIPLDGAEFVMGLPAVDVDVIIRNRPIDVQEGYCNVPAGPGLGFELDETEVKRHALDRVVVGAK